ncbi:hypothetical protein ACN47E_007976 [Coniothyrium glycines]
MTKLVRKSAIDAEIAQSDHHDKILVQNLAVTVNAGKDVWGRPKKQRAELNVILTLGSQFSSASTTDSVDDSTVHYGTLSKALQAHVEETLSRWKSTAALSGSIAQCVRNMAGSTSIYALETDVRYLKGSMYGDGVSHITTTIESTNQRSSVLYLRNVQIPCLIGVNSNERLQKQPVIVNAWIDGLPESRLDDYPELEALLFQLVSESSFQTIESLLAWLVDELRQKFFTKEGDQQAWIRLRIEKPLAVPFADAPAVEITRPV